jgi:hypothetical protein
VFVEGIFAGSVNHNLPPLAIDRDHADLLNAFVDVKVAETNGNPWYVRVGRQELLFGSQRLVSTLDWANARRTFQGVRLLHQTEKFDFDLFWTQPVRTDPSRFNSVDNNQNFAGLWTTWRPEKGQAVDGYYLFLDNTNRISSRGIDIAPYNVHTIGSRYAGDKDGFLWDFEGMLQLGERGDNSILAGAGTVGLGYNVAKSKLNPTFWVYYDYASGDQSPNSGTYTTFNQLFPFGHFYLGWLDLVGRQNVHDLSLHMTLNPAKWISMNVQYHSFYLNSPRDALYNAGGAVLRHDPLGASGRSIGNELDLIFNFHVSAQSDILVGFSKLFPGSFLENTGSARSPELFYLMYNFRW